MTAPIDLPTPSRYHDILLTWNIVDAPDEAAWKLARHKLLTASDVAGVMGLSPHKSRNKVLADKRLPAPPDVYVTSPMRAGQFQEEGIFRWWLGDLAYHNQELGLPAPWGTTCRLPSGASMLVRHPTARLGASPDGLVLDAGCVDILTEIKVTNPNRWLDSWGLPAMKVPRAWAAYSKVEPPSVGKCPLQHWVQLQTQLLVCGIGQGVVVGACGTARLDFTFSADPHFQQCILEATDKFWKDVEAT